MKVINIETNLIKEIEKEHQRAELQRLDEGWPGCGCSLCQKLYKEINLEKYGSRVIILNESYIIKSDSSLHKDEVEIKYYDEYY